MNCPYCNFHFGVLVANSPVLPPIAPIVCESCANVSLLVNGAVRKASVDEMEALKEAPVWKSIIEPVILIIERTKKAQRAVFN